MERINNVLFCVVFFLIQYGCETLAERAVTCSDCVRNPNACRRISGLYTVTVLTQGTYNPVVEIPSPACNINITEFGRSSNYIALKTKRGAGILNSYWGLGQPGQYYGAGARFSYDRESGSCKGTCIYSVGPTSEAIVVQILYNDKNPGISYEFTLPNHVIFTPFEGTYSKQRTAGQGSKTSSTSSGRHRHHGSRTHRRHRNRQQSERTNFQGEYYTGSQYSRSEGRPEGTEALEAGPDPDTTSRTSSALRRTSYNYNNRRYGSHTLGGKGLSYTSAVDRETERSSRRESGRRVIDRYRPRQPRPTTVRKIAPPTYVSGHKTRQTTYPRQPQYQSFSASKTDYLDNRNTVDQYESGSISSQSSSSRSRGPSRDSFRWKISGFTECSKTCGGGVQKTNIVCVSSNERAQVVVTPEDCVNSLKPREQVVECNTSPCEPAWESDEWSECSVTCGSGTQTRTVECRQRFSPSLTLRVSADQCGLQAKPAVAQQCEKGLCSQWKTGQWGQCSRDCGGGERTRSVYCVDQFESQIPSNYCREAIPVKKEICNTERCISSWWVSQWDKECSTSCGQGQLTRSAVCLNDRGRVLPDTYCVQRDQPEVTKSCRSDVGCSGAWFAGPWDKCSSSCGEGTRVRRVVCMRQDKGTLEISRDEDCDASVRPESQENCVGSNCRATWYTNDWSGCSVTCGEGYRTREVRCVESQRASTRCIVAAKPSTQEVCKLSPCLSYQRINRYVRRRKQRQELTLQGLSERQITARESPDVVVSWDDKKDERKEEENTNEANSKDVMEGDDGQRLEVAKPAPRTKTDSRCRDQLSHCLYVLQSRLCPYPYYQDKCCHTCSKKHH